MYQTILLVDYGTNDPFWAGIPLGRAVFEKLFNFVRDHPAVRVFCISMKGAPRTDSSFPREAVVTLIERFSGTVAFFLRDFDPEDVIENWDLAAKIRNVSILVDLGEGRHTVIGAELSEPIRVTLDFVMSKGEVRTADVAEHFDLKMPAARGRMKTLTDANLVVAVQETAESGGPVFVFHALF